MARLWPTTILVLLLLTGAAAAQGLPGTVRPPAEAGGWLAGLYAWIQHQQALLQRELAGLLGQLRRGEGGALAGLVAGAGLYGILHAAGPGHGKLIVSAYLFANGSRVVQGLALALVSSLAQAASALLLVGGLVLLLDQARLAVTRDVHLLELASYGLIVLFGLTMLWRSLRGRSACGHDHAAEDHAHHHGADCHHHHHGHAPPPEGMRRRDFWAMVLSVGIRPCSGAVIVLLFTFGQGLAFAGIASVVAMALGTFVTVATLALFALYARRAALAMAGRRGSTLVARGAGLLGALAVTGLGALLFWATWTTPPTL